MEPFSVSTFGRRRQPLRYLTDREVVCLNNELPRPNRLGKTKGVSLGSDEPSAIDSILTPDGSTPGQMRITLLNRGFDFCHLGFVAMTPTESETRPVKSTAPQVARRIAMWSGPRNISTAMMRSFDSRPDTVVCDEPLYAHYLTQTQYDFHPCYRATTTPIMSLGVITPKLVGFGGSMVRPLRKSASTFA